VRTSLRASPFDPLTVEKFRTVAAIVRRPRGVPNHWRIDRGELVA
jgi:hypothetical protein